MIPKGIFVLYYFLCGIITGIALAVIYRHLKESWLETKAIKDKARELNLAPPFEYAKIDVIADKQVTIGDVYVANASHDDKLWEGMKDGSATVEEIEAHLSSTELGGTSR